MSRRAAAVAVLAGGLLFERAAGAQPVGPAPARAPGIPEVTNAPESGVAPKTSPRSFKLFDQRRSTPSYALEIGPIWVRKVEDNSPRENARNFERGTGEIKIGTVITTPFKRLYLAGFQSTLLRVIDSKSFSWSVFHQELIAGARIGPFEPEVRLGLGVLTADVFRAEWSAQLLTPRVSAGVGMRLGKIRVDLKAHSEYLWRWFGPDYVIRGVSLGLRLDVPRPNNPLESPSK